MYSSSSIDKKHVKDGVHALVFCSKKPDKRIRNTGYSDAIDRMLLFLKQPDINESNRFNMNRR